MGHFEKIVVLLAIFLVTVILVVTFSEDGEKNLNLTMGESDSTEVSGEDPHGLGNPEETERGALLARGGGTRGDNPRSRQSESDGPLFTQLTEDEPGSELPLGLQARSLLEQQQGRGKGSLYLDGGFSAPTGAEQGQSRLPAGAALRTLVDLRPTFDETIMEYTWQRNDNWSALAERLYGVKEKSALLRQFNEGSTYVAPGTAILVPVFDGRTTAPDVEGAPGNAQLPREKLSVERGNLYLVMDGDSLWVIAKKVYGKGSEWEKIYNANKDVLTSPESVQQGMELRIP